MVRNFEKAVAEHTAWLQQSAQLFEAAEVLCKELRRPQLALGDDDNARKLGCLKGALLLLSFAVENGLKAVPAAKGQIAVTDGGHIHRRSFRAGDSGHDLRALAIHLGLVVTEAESELLVRLTSIAIWAGRYHFPLHEKAYNNAVQNEPRKIRLPRDISIAKSILTKAAVLLPVE